MSAKGIIETVIEELSFLREGAVCHHQYRKAEDNLKLLAESVENKCDKLRDDLRRALGLME